MLGFECRNDLFTKLDIKISHSPHENLFYKPVLQTVPHSNNLHNFCHTPLTDLLLLSNQMLHKQHPIDEFLAPRLFSSTVAHHQGSSSSSRHHLLGRSSHPEERAPNDVQQSCPVS